MREVSVVGIGRTAVGEHWELSLRELALEAVKAAMQDAGIGPDDVDALVIGNALAGLFSHQTHLGPSIAAYVGLRGVEAFTVEGADASGGLAVRQGTLLVGSDAARTVIVLGIEKVTDCVGLDRNAALAAMTDADYEAANGATPTAMAALLMRRYMHEYGLTLSQFEGFSINAHANGSKNPGAMFRNTIKPGRFTSAPVVAEPVNLFDSAPEADGAAALVLTTTERALDMVPKPVRILASAAATDTLSLAEREEFLFLSAVNVAAGRAFKQSGKTPHDMDVVELHDAYTVLSALQLEAAGFAEQGRGWTLAAEGKIGLNGPAPISTFGGLKARGNPLGATGVYQAGEVALQLRGEAGDNQVPNARLGMTLNLGGSGSTAVAHILERVDVIRP
jgi:acetyl-CoA C-acetyltransferase